VVGEFSFLVFIFGCVFFEVMVVYVFGVVELVVGDLFGVFFYLCKVYYLWMWVEFFYECVWV